MARKPWIWSPSTSQTWCSWTSGTPGLTGIEAAREIARLDPTDEWPGEVVFITAYDQYAVEAFEQGVIDYVLKPAERERLQLTVERVKAAPATGRWHARLATRASRAVQAMLAQLQRQAVPACKARVRPECHRRQAPRP